MLQTAPSSLPENLHSAIVDLAGLRIKIDRSLVAGEMVFSRILSQNYELKRAELLNAIVTMKLSDVEEFERLFALEVERLQEEEGVSADSDKIKERLHEQVLQRLFYGTHLVFHKVPPGSYIKETESGQVEVILTKMPEVMANHVTQEMYRTVANLARKRFPGKYKINPDPSFSKGALKPVHGISLNDIENWTNALNELLADKEKALTELIPGHKKGMRYEAFMTEAQHELLVKIATTEDGDSVDEMVFRNDADKLRHYAALGGLDEDLTNELELFEPLYIDGKPFYGLCGNTWSWQIPSWPSLAIQEGGIDPVGNGGHSTRNPHRWYGNARKSRGPREFDLPEIGKLIGSFRLVRKSR